MQVWPTARGDVRLTAWGRPLEAVAHHGDQPNPRSRSGVHDQMDDHEVRGDVTTEGPYPAGN
jgi:hypothetical protein